MAQQVWGFSDLGSAGRNVADPAVQERQAWAQILEQQRAREQRDALQRAQLAQQQASMTQGSALAQQQLAEKRRQFDLTQALAREQGLATRTSEESLAGQNLAAQQAYRSAQQDAAERQHRESMGFGREQERNRAAARRVENAFRATDLQLRKAGMEREQRERQAQAQMKKAEMRAAGVPLSPSDEAAAAFAEGISGHDNVSEMVSDLANQRLRLVHRFGSQTDPAVRQFDESVRSLFEKSGNPAYNPWDWEQQQEQSGTKLDPSTVNQVWIMLRRSFQMGDPEGWQRYYRDVLKQGSPPAGTMSPPEAPPPPLPEIPSPSPAPAPTRKGSVGMAQPSRAELARALASLAFPQGRQTFDLLDNYGLAPY